MKSSRRSRAAGVLALALFLLAAPARAERESQPVAPKAAKEFLEPESAASAELQAENPTVERIEEIRAQIAAERD